MRMDHGFYCTPGMLEDPWEKGLRKLTNLLHLLVLYILCIWNNTDDQLTCVKNWLIFSIPFLKGSS